jgi:NADPH:quinone reductase-like Zn-dependent oxidoreductase
MEAWSYDGWGGPEVVRLGELPEPEVGDGQVLVEVTAAGVNPADHRLRSGGAAQLPHRFPIVPGLDVAGRVAAVGSDVDGFAVGRRVMGYLGVAFMVDGGSWARMVAVDAGSLVVTPDAVSDELAGALPCVGLTALLMADTLSVSAGDRVLVHAAAGGVGHLFVQLAVARGAEVVGTASPRNFDYLRSLGAEPVAYGDGRTDLARVASRPFDAVADFYGGDALAESARFLALGARVATAGASTFADAPRIGVRPDARALAELASLVADDELRVRVADVVPFDRATEALATVEEGAAAGKLVVLGPQ